MRVIGGSARGRPLRAPKTDVVRPTADRVREAIFDVLSSLSVLPQASVVDLFSGTGALGIEAASRGASKVTFVERDHSVISFIRQNIEKTAIGDECETRVIERDVLTYSAANKEHFDVALIDPPYRFLEWEKLLDTIDADFIVCESDGPIALGQHFVLHREYRYGTTLVTVAKSKGHVNGGNS